jgi:lipopolysaccharide transport system ATP-binding protein
MSSELLVSVDNVCKTYQGYRKPIHRLWQSLFGNKLKLSDEFKALEGVGLKLHRGETARFIPREEFLPCWS